MDTDLARTLFGEASVTAIEAARALHDLRTAPAFIRHAEAAREFAAIMRRRSRGWRRHVRRRKAGLA